MQVTHKTVFFAPVLYYFEAIWGKDTFLLVCLLFFLLQMLERFACLVHLQQLYHFANLNFECKPWATVLCLLELTLPHNGWLWPDAPGYRFHLDHVMWLPCQFVAISHRSVIWLYWPLMLENTQRIVFVFRSWHDVLLFEIFYLASLLHFVKQAL